MDHSDYDFLLKCNEEWERWEKALNSTCKSLDMMWLIKYYEELPWYDSDLFDGEIEEELYKHIPGRKNPNPYFLYLLHNRPVKFEEEKDG